MGLEAVANDDKVVIKKDGGEGEGKGKERDDDSHYFESYAYNGESAVSGNNIPLRDD